jgi:peptidoglycan/LPS O-acetylase OafA/YrhL
MTLVKVVIRVGAACLALITGVACSFWLNLNAGLAPICMGTCFGLLIPFIRLHHPRLIVNGLMIYVGRLSYSIYLANMFVVMSLNYLLHEFFHIKVPQTAFPLCYLSFVTILCIVATATKKHIEDPMIDIGHALSSRMIQMEKRPESFCSTRG